MAARIVRTMMKRIACVMLLVAGGGACKSKPAVNAGNQGQGKTVALEWKATQGEGELVTVTLLVAGEPVTLGTLNAAADDAPGTPAQCKVGDKPTPTTAEFWCGGTPAYNYFHAEIVGKELVITHISGVDAAVADPGAKEEVKEVKRVPVKGGTLTVAPFTPPAAAPPA